MAEPALPPESRPMSASSPPHDAITRAAIIGGVAFVLLAIVAGYAVVQEWRASTLARHWVDHSYETIDQIRRVFDDVQDAESGARGFFINGDVAFLDPYNVGLARIDRDVAELRATTADNADQQKRINDLQPLLARKIEAMRAGVERRRSAGHAIPSDPIVAASARMAMEQIRAAIAAMIDDERRLLVARGAERERSTRSNLTIMAASFVVAAMSIAVTLILTLGYLQRRRVSEAVLAAQTALLTATLENISQALGVYDADLKLLAWNDRYREFSGLDNRMLVRGMPLIDMLREAARQGELGTDAQQWIADRMAQLRSRVPYEFERQRPDGTVLQVRGAFTEEGLAVTTFSDITGLKRTERDLLGNVARLNAIFDNTLDGIITINESGSIETFNPAAEKIFGYGVAEVLGRNIKILMPEPYRGAHDGHLRSYRMTGEKKMIGVRRELEGMRKDGTVFPIELSINEFSSGGRRLFVGMVRDISERRQVERLKNEFVSTVSHELRTPLTSIAGSLGLLAGAAAGDLPDRAKRLVEIANKNSQRLVRLVNDILDLDKIESGQMRFSFVPLSLRSLVETCLETNRGYADEFDVRFVLDPTAKDGTILGDADRLVQVLTNLLSNAAKFSPAGGQVEIRIDDHGHRLRVSVRDHGPGIPDDFRATMFQKFAQADSKDNRRKGGTGLGLNIARSIVERHGGALSFDSVPGAGATFHVDLPIWEEGVDSYNSFSESRAAGSVEHDAPGIDRPAGPLRVLHVEDDEDIRRVVGLALDGVAELVAARSMAEARRSLAADSFDLVILDIALPDGNGLTLLPMPLSRSGATLPVLVFSSQEADVPVGQQVQVALTKSKASTTELVRQVRALAAKR